MPMPTPLPLSNTQFISSLYNSATQDYGLAYPCPAHELRNPSLSLNLMPPKSVSLYSPLDPLDEDDDDDLPPLVEAPPASVDPGDEQEGSAATVDQDTTRRIGEGAGGVTGPVGGNSGNIQYTFESTITPSTFGATSSPMLTSHSSIQRVHASDAPIDPRHGTFRLTSSPIFAVAQPTPLNAQSRSAHHARTGIESGGERSGFGARIEPPSPSNADAGSTPSPAPSPSFGADSTTTTTSPPPLSLTLDEQREPSSGLSRTGAHGQGQGGGRKPPRPPSYIPRPPNAFILFRASFVRSQRLESPSPTSIGSTGLTTGGVSALGQGSVVTIEPSSSSASPSGGKRGNKASGFGGIGHGGTTAPTSSTSLSKLAGQIWRSMPPDQRAVWESRARVAQAEHRAKYPDWRFRPENASGIGVGTGPGNTFWSGGGTTMGSVPWGGGGTGGGGEDWGGAVAAGKPRGGGTNKGGGGGVRIRKKKEKDRDRDKEKEASKGKERTGVGTNTDSSSHPSPDPSSSASSSTKTKRGRWRSARASPSTSALGVPSWALPALGFVGDNVANPGANSSTGATAAVEDRKASTEPGNTKETSKGGSSNATHDQSKNQEQMMVLEREYKGRQRDKGENTSAPVSAKDESSCRGSETQTQGSGVPRAEVLQHPESNLIDRVSPGSTEGNQTGVASSQEQVQPLEGRSEEVQDRENARLGVPSTTIAQRSASIESGQRVSAGSEAVMGAEENTRPATLPPPPSTSSDSTVSTNIVEAASQSLEVEMTSSTRGVQERQHQGLSGEFDHGEAFFPDPTVRQHSDSSISQSASSSSSSSGVDTAPHQHSRSQSFPQPQSQAQAMPAPTQLPFRLQSQSGDGSEARTQPSVPFSATQPRPLPSRGVTVVTGSTGGTGGVVRTARRNTVAIATLPGAPANLPGARQLRMGIPNVLPAASISPGTGIGAGSYGYGQMHGYERGLDFEQHSPPPPSPEVSSPLSAISPTYTGHGSPSFMPFSAHAQIGPHSHRLHPYAHARSHSFHYPTQHHAQTQAREHMPSAIASSVTLPAHHEHAEQMVTQAPFLFPVTQPSFYERVREQQGNTGVERDVGMDITMDTDTGGSVSGMMPSGSATTSTLTSVYSTGGTVPLPTRLSSYSSLIGWAGTASSFGPGSEADASPDAVFGSSFTGGGTGADASTFSPHAFAYVPYPHADSGEWYGYNFGGGGQNIENPAGGGTSGMIGSVGASVDTDAIAFGPGPNFTPTPSPTEGPSDEVQRSQLFAPQELFHNSSQSQSQSALSPPLSHGTPPTRSHYDTLFSVPGVFQSPSDSGGEFVPIPDYSGGHRVSGVHGSPGVVASSGGGNDDSGGRDVSYLLDRYRTEPPHDAATSPRALAKERRK